MKKSIFKIKIKINLLCFLNSLMKDMTGKDDQFRGPAIRALCSITDVSIPYLLLPIYY